jgi:hypothetical protein
MFGLHYLNCFFRAACAPGQMEDKASHMEVSLVFFSTFEPISLTPDSCMQQNGIPMLYVWAVSNMMCYMVCNIIYNIIYYIACTVIITNRLQICWRVFLMTGYPIMLKLLLQSLFFGLYIQSVLLHVLLGHKPKVP